MIQLFFVSWLLYSRLCGPGCKMNLSDGNSHKIFTNILLTISGTCLHFKKQRFKIKVARRIVYKHEPKIISSASSTNATKVY